MLVSALVLALVAVGCGGSSGDDATTSSISKVEFVKGANAICKKGAEKLHTDFLAFSSERSDNPKASPAEYEEYIDRVIAPDLSREVAEMRTLGVPEGGEEQVETMLSAIGEGVENAEAKPTAVITANRALFSNAIKLTTAYGLAACAASY